MQNISPKTISDDEDNGSTNTISGGRKNTTKTMYCLKFTHLNSTIHFFKGTGQRVGRGYKSGINRYV